MTEIESVGLLDIWIIFVNILSVCLLSKHPMELSHVVQCTGQGRERRDVDLVSSWGRFCMIFGWEHFLENSFASPAFNMLLGHYQGVRCTNFISWTLGRVNWPNLSHIQASTCEPTNPLLKLLNRCFKQCCDTSTMLLDHPIWVLSSRFVESVSPPKHFLYPISLYSFIYFWNQRLLRVALVEIYSGLEEIGLKFS